MLRRASKELSIFLALGNHDLQRLDSMKWFTEFCRQAEPAINLSDTVGSLRIVVINTYYHQPDGTISLRWGLEFPPIPAMTADQEQWLDSRLAKTCPNPTVIVCHATAYPVPLTATVRIRSLNNMCWIMPTRFGRYWSDIRMFA